VLPSLFTTLKPLHLPFRTTFSSMDSSEFTFDSTSFQLILLALHLSKSFNANAFITSSSASVEVLLITLIDWLTETRVRKELFVCGCQWKFICKYLQNPWTEGSYVKRAFVSRGYLQAKVQEEEESKLKFVHWSVPLWGMHREYSHSRLGVLSVLGYSNCPMLQS